MAVCRWCREAAEETGHCASCGRPAAEDPSALVGATLGSHQLGRLLGEGPVGATFEAVHVPSGEKVRVKLIDSALLSTEPELAEAVTQLVLGATGIHPALPELVEISLESPDGAIISSQWLEGPTLREVLAAGPLEPAEAVRVTIGLLEALEALHQAGLSHRDVKPENVIVAPEGSPAPVGLLDVGVSLASARSRTAAFYRSPEQARGAGAVGPATDIYGAGVILYEGLSGKRPFESNDFDVLMSRISVRRPPHIAELRPDLPAGLTQVVDQAMAQDPSERFPSARDMIIALEAVADSLAAAAAPPPAPVAPPVVVAAPAPLPVVTPAAAAPMVAPELEPDQTMSGSGSKPINKVAAAFFVGLALAAGGAMIWYTMVGGQELPAETQPAEDTEGPTTKAPAKSRGTISVHLQGLPPGAIIKVDGRRLGANPFRAPRDSHVHKIHVAAPGHDPFETSLTFTEDRLLEVEMTEQDFAPELGDFRAHKRGPGANVVRRHKGARKISVKRSTPHLPDTEKAQLRDRSAHSPR